MRSPNNRTMLILCIASAFWAATLSADDSAYQSGYGANASWQTSLDIEEDAAPQLLWSQTVGEGRSQVVCDKQHVYVVSGHALQPKTDPKRLTTKVTALKVQSGSEVWSFEIQSQRYPGQETFSGAKPCPRATPVLHNGRLFVVSFSGQLICLNAADGRQLWEVDLIEDLQAVPVQFGFSASVVVDPSYPDRICVVAAGPIGGFCCLSVADGTEVWNATCSTFSYATPVMAHFGGHRQWILVTEDEVLSVAADSGQSLWAYKLLEPGLTNVPTPLVVNDHQLLISGQGCKGTVSLQVKKTDQVWSVSQFWVTSRLQFFYTNWVKLSDQVVIGCTDKYLAALSVETGDVLGRWRGFSDAHVLNCSGDKLLILGGRGKLSVLMSSATEANSQLTIERQYQLIDRRCWTPLSVAGQKWFLRYDNQLCCYTFGNSETDDVVKQLAGDQRKLAFANRGEKETRQMTVADPVELIFAEFESQGAEAALQVYNSLRADSMLNEVSRIELIQAARQIGQKQIAALVLKQALSDFPKSKAVQALILK